MKTFETISIWTTKGRLEQKFSIQTLVFLLLAFTCISPVGVQAQTLYWDQNGTSSGTGGTGNWLGGSTWRLNSSSGTLQAWADSNLADFGGTAGTVTLNGAVSATGLTFETSAYIIAGGSTLTLPGTPSISLSASGTLSETISAAVSATSQVTIGTTAGGNGTLSLSNTANSFSGGIKITAAGSTTMRLNFNGSNSGGTGVGAGVITVATGRAIISNASADTTAGTITNTVANGIDLGGNAVAIGATGVSAGTNPLILEFDGKITGTGDVVVQTSSPTTNTPAGGGVTVFANSGNDYSGQTIVNNSSSAVLRLGTSNALPNTTALVFGRGSTTNTGSLDTNGKDLTVASLATNLGSGATANGITNTVSGTQSTLTISGSASTTYASTIGTPLATGGNLTGASANIALTLASTNSGMLTLTGANNYTGATKINGGTLSPAAADALKSTSRITVNNTGTLLLGGTGDRIGNAVPVTVGGGGKFATASLSEGTRPAGPAGTGGAAGLGALTLTGTSGAASVIDFGSTTGGSSLVFTSLDAGSKGAYVSILNWGGTANTDTGTTTNDRLLFATDPGFTDADLANFAFNGFTSGATEIAYGNVFEIVPVPEPATVLGGVLLVGALGWNQRRRLGGLAGLLRNARAA